MASPSPIRRSSRLQNNEHISENTNTLNILAKHEDNDISKPNVYNKEVNNNNISPIKSKNASPMINGGSLNQLDNEGILQSTANVNSETKPINDAVPGNALSNIGRLLRSAAKSNPCTKPVSETPGRVLKSYPEIEPDNDYPQGNYSLHKGGIIQSRTITEAEIESTPPGKPSSGGGRLLRSKAKPVHDTPPGKHSLGSETALRSIAKSIPEIEPVNDTSPGNHSLDSGRVLRSRTKANPETKHVNDTSPGNSVMEESNPETESLNNTPPVRGRKKEKAPNNEYSVLFKRVRHLLTWMKYKQNLINAYSSEVWKGQSTEKVKPEKEIVQAKSDILKFKLEIRVLFQRLDFALSEGKIDDTLFDSEGQIDSEDIYCAKCHSKDVSTDNDIILCDGMCVRAFHQKCLNPPLLSENIPVGDDGWLCPACECKIDCIKLLIEFHGSTMELTDTWEKVFPEAAEIRNGDKDDDGLPSGDFKKSTTSVANSETGTKFGEEILAELDRDLKQENEELLGKRKIEILNYKKFHDETYGKSSSDSSDDESFSETYDTSDDDWRAQAGIRTPTKRKNKRKKYARRYKNYQKSNGNSHNQDHPELHSTSKKSYASPHRKIYRTTKQRLYDRFLENQYPSREEKESLAQELGIGYLQVSNWFSATRHKTRNGLYASPSKLMMPDDTSAETPPEHPEKENILPKAPLKEGSMINEIDMVAPPCSFPMPNIVNGHASGGSTSIKEIDMSAPPSSFPTPNRVNTNVNAGTTTINETDMSAPAGSFSLPNTADSYVNAGTTSISEIDMGASVTSFTMPSISNSYVGAGISGINEINMGTSPSTFPMPNTTNNYVSTGTTGVGEQPNKRDMKEKVYLEIPLKEGTSLSQIDIQRQKAIARELKKMKQGR